VTKKGHSERLILSFWGCVSNRRIPSFYETLRLRLRVTKRGSFWASAKNLIPFFL